MHTNLLVDINNLVFAYRHAKIKPATSVRSKQKFVTETLFIDCLSAVIRFAKKLKANSIVVMRDSPNIWRKDICAEYKANHTSSIDDIYYKDTVAAADMLCEFFETCTAVTVYSYARAEADDLIGIWCQESGSVNIILSSDKDFVQLLEEGKTTLFSPVQDVFRTSEDPQYDLFLKCVRGDSGDNVRSAFPKVRETLLKKAWGDNLEMLNLLETVRPDGVKVGDALMQNIALIDLSQQPTEMRKSIINKFKTTPPQTFNMTKSYRFFGEKGLKERLDVLDNGAIFLKKSPVF
jgi:hypothetical protein